MYIKQINVCMNAVVRSKGVQKHPSMSVGKRLGTKKQSRYIHIVNDNFSIYLLYTATVYCNCSKALGILGS
jgi:hypothetical protein